MHDIGRLPQHVAIVMDGNGRWAAQRHLPRIAGHRAGVDAVRCIIKIAQQKNIKVLSLFAFSTENWQRPPQEVSYLMGLLLSGLQKEVKKLHEHHIKLRVIGDVSKLSTAIQTNINKAQALTAQNTGINLVVAINYGGRWDITQAACRLAHDVAAGKVDAQAISQQVFAQYMCLKDLPPVDLFIRTSGELRISNFFLWQLAYAELYFSDALWPDFDEDAFNKALVSFATRKRRFGNTVAAK